MAASRDHIVDKVGSIKVVDNTTTANNVVVPTTILLLIYGSEYPISTLPISLGSPGLAAGANNYAGQDPFSSSWGPEGRTRILRIRNKRLIDENLIWDVVRCEIRLQISTIFPRGTIQ